MKLYISYILYILFLNITFSQNSEIDTCNILIENALENSLKNDYTKQLDFLFEAREIAYKEGFKREAFLSNNNIGLIYFKMSDYSNAIKYYLKAYEIALENNSDEEKMTMLNNIALVFLKDEDHKKAKAYLKRAYSIARKTNKNVKIGFYASNLAELNLFENNLDIANKYLMEALPNLEEVPYAHLNALVLKYCILMKKGNYRHAIKKLEKLLVKAINLNQDALLEVEVNLVSKINFLLATAHSDLKEWSLANKYLANALKSCFNSSKKIEIFKQQFKIAYNLHDLEKAIVAKDSIIKLTKLIYDKEEKQLLKNSKLQFELKQSQNDLAVSKIVSNNQKRTYIIITFFILMIMLLLISVQHKKKENSNQKRIIAENNLRLNELKLQHEKNTSLLLNKELEKKQLKVVIEEAKVLKLKHKIEEKNKELYNKVLFQSTRNELIEEVVESISKIDEAPKNDALKKATSSLKQHLKDSVKWNEFSSSFENINSTFIKTLKARHPDLNANDIRFISYIYLNLNNKEIASVLNITPEACRKRKERLKKKLNLTSITSLYQLFSQIY